jgi:hypothetical protein
MSWHKAPLAVIFAAACVPQNATITEGSYVAMLAESNSQSLVKRAVDPEHKDFTTKFIMDCRTLDDDLEALRLADRIPMDCDQLNENEYWMMRNAYYGVGQDLDPWRGEALITSEGDLQLGFHQRIPGGEDFRFSLVVDPTFQPTKCVAEGDGVATEEIDGDWIDNWSADMGKLRALMETDESAAAAYAHMEEFLDDGRMYYLNSGGYQFNPLATGSYWFFPEHFQAGFAAGKFAEELFATRGPRYGETYIYDLDPDGIYSQEPPASDLWYCDMGEGADPETAPCTSVNSGFATHAEMVAAVNEDANAIQTELQRMRATDDTADTDAFVQFRPIVDENVWRVPDGYASGFDGWAGLQYNWVVFSGDSDLSVGGNARGAFSMLVQAIESETVIFVQGKFELENIKAERWANDDVRQDKLDAAGVELCIGS